MAVQKFEKDLETLIKRHAKAKEEEEEEKGWRRREVETQWILSRSGLIGFFREVEAFRELDEGKRGAGKSRSVSPIQPEQKSIVSHRRVDSYRKTQRLKLEVTFFNTLWSSFMSADSPTCELDIALEVLKVLFNHYIPVPKQVQLLSELQKLVTSYSFAGQPRIDEIGLEEQIVKPFQSLYPHFFSLTNITRLANLEKVN